uniref:C-type lectin domain-containing protein n=1 Tax=Acrobeloides nanus TaxID=290746 RepID=A0A914CHQ0_9BILA
MTNIFVTIDFDNMGVACPPPLLVHVWIACTAPLIQQLPNIGTRYIVIGKGPFRSGDYDGITYTHGMIASNIVDDGHHIMGDSGNNAEYSGGLVLSRKGHSLLGLITSRTSECYNKHERSNFLIRSIKNAVKSPSVYDCLACKGIIRRTELAI